jgi:hypothetical protein
MSSPSPVRLNSISIYSLKVKSPPPPFFGGVKGVTRFQHVEQEANTVSGGFLWVLTARVPPAFPSATVPRPPNDLFPPHWVLKLDRTLNTRIVGRMRANSYLSK